MKLSTKIQKYVAPCYYEGKTITLITCGGDGRHSRYVFDTLAAAETKHKELVKQGFKLLPLNECPVINPGGVVMHYAEK